MILSMTGFAAVAAELPGASLAVELRSVNHRYLDLTLKLPDELRIAEPALREILAGALKRGKVECRIALNRTAQAANTLAVDAQRVSQLAAAAWHQFCGLVCHLAAGLGRHHRVWRAGAGGLAGHGHFCR